MGSDPLIATVVEPLRAATSRFHASYTNVWPLSEIVFPLLSYVGADPPETVLV